MFDVNNLVAIQIGLASPEKIKWLRETFNGYCTEMEGAAVAHVCHIFELPFLVIRAISDKADDDAKMDYPEFVKLAAKNSKTGFVKIALNFCVSQELLMEAQNRFYPTDRFKALIENYFDGYKGRMAELMQEQS